MLGQRARVDRKGARVGQQAEQVGRVLFEFDKQGCIVQGADAERARG